MESIPIQEVNTKHWLHYAKWSKMPTIKSGWSIKTPIKRSPVHCYFCTLHRMGPYYLYRYSNVLKLAPMLEGLLLEVMCKEELKRTITHDFMYISVGLVFFGPLCIWPNVGLYKTRYMKTMKCLGHLNTLLQYSVGDGITSFTKFPALKNLFSFPFLNGRYQVIVKKTPKKCISKP